MKIVNSYKAKILSVNRALKPTIDIYKSAVSFFIVAINNEWFNISALNPKQRVNAVEKLTHKTKNNLSPKYDFDYLFYKFPCYLRRSAIQDAIGIVSSFQTKLEAYNNERYIAISNGRRFQRKPPKLQLNHYKCPALYKGNMFTPIDRTTYEIKIYKNNDWVWQAVSLREQDIKYIENHVTGNALSPILTRKGNNYYLQFPFEKKVTLSSSQPKYQTIIAVDLGLNNTAVCCAMRSDGTVIGRKFINQPVEKDRLNHAINRLCKKQKQSGKYSTCVKAWNYINNLKQEIVNKTTHEIVEFATKHHAEMIVFEYLGKFKPSKGKRNKQYRMRIQQWCKRTIQLKVEHKAHSAGIRVNRVSPAYTSALAFDGSGFVVRDDHNFSICALPNGKTYHTDLNATYNIGARYFIREIQKSIPEKAWSLLVAKVPSLERRTQCTLSTLISLQKVV